MWQRSDPTQARDQLSPFATASLLAVVVAAGVLVGVRWYATELGVPTDGDPRRAADTFVDAGARGLLVGTALVILATWLLCRYRIGLPLPELRVPPGAAPVRGRWLAWLLLGAAVVVTMLLLGVGAMVFLWTVLMVPVTVVAALSSSGDA
jgi:hypothetical protein